MKKISMILFTSVMVAIAFAAAAMAQVERGSIVGTITDKSGAVTPGVEVTVTNENTNATVAVRTDESGNYAAVNLLAGSYTVSAKNIGFSNQVFKGFVLQVGQEARLNIVLEVGAVEQVVEVNAVAPLLQTENASVGQVIAPEPIAALPLNGRNFVQLAILAPGVSGLNYAQPGTINSGARPDELRPGGTTLQANGVRSYLNQVMVDGIDATEMISQTFVVPRRLKVFRNSKSSPTMPVRNLGGPEELSLSSTPSRAATRSMDLFLSSCAIRPWTRRTFSIGPMTRSRRFGRTSLAEAWAGQLGVTALSSLRTMKASARWLGKHSW
jgi:hypothetical protein